MKHKNILALLMSILMILVQLPVVAEETAEKTFSVVSTTPFDKSKNISPVNLKVDVVFSEPVDKSTLKVSNISVSKNAFGSIAQTGDDSISIYFKRDSLVLGEKYTVVLKKGIKSMSGANLEEKKITFTLSKNAPKYRQISNSDLSDPDFITGYGGDTTTAISIVKDGDNNVLKFNPPWNEAAIKQKAFCSGNTVYHARARVKTTEDQKIWFAFYFNVPGDGDFYHGRDRKVIKANEWTTIEASWVVPANADLSNMIIMIAAEKTADIMYIDDWDFYPEGFDVKAPEFSGGSTEESFTKVSTQNKEIEKIQALGIIPYGVSEAGTVKRIDLAKIVLNVIDKNRTYAGINEIFYDDVPESMEETVSAVSGLDIMVGYNRHEFRPDNPVTAEEAAKVILSMMGWTAVKNEESLYPDYYMNAAFENGLFKNVKVNKDDTLTYNDLAKMFVNILDKRVIVSKDLEGNFGKGDTFLDKYFDCEEGTGIIEATHETSLYGESDIPENYVTIDGVTYECDYDMNEYLGCKVKYYFVKNKDDVNDKLLYVYNIDKNEIVEFSSYADDIMYSDNRYEVTYKGEKKNNSYKLLRNKTVIYNGKYLGEYTDDASVMIPVYGKVKLIDNGNGFCVVNIIDYETVVVSLVDYNNQKIFGTMQNQEIELENCEKLTIKDNKNDSYSFDDIKVNQVLTVARSKDGKIAQIFISEEKQNGFLCKVFKDSDVQKIAVGDEFYGANVRKNYETVNGYFNPADVPFDKIGVFYIDFMGRVAMFKSGKGDLQVGYLFKLWVGDDNYEEEIMMRVYGEDDKFHNLKISEKVRIDGNSKKTPDDIRACFMDNSGKLIPQLILYKLNDAGKVTSIDTAYNKKPDCADYRKAEPENKEEKESFRVTYSSILPPNSLTTPEKIKFNPYARTFNNKVQLEFEPTMFLVPIDPEDEEAKYRISKNVWDLGDDSTSVIESYKLSGDNYFTDYLVIYLDRNNYNTEHMSGAEYGIVKNKTALIIDDDVVNQIELIDGTKIFTDDEQWVKEANTGDYIEFKRDRYSYLIEKINVAFDASEKKVIGNNPHGSVDDWNRFYFANIYGKKETTVKIVSPMTNMSDKNAGLEAEIINVSGVPVYIYNSKGNGKIRQGTTDDIMDYQSTGDNYSKAFISFRKAVPTAILIIE